MALYKLVFLLVFVHCSVQEVYYVKPTSDHDCEQLQPCNTLSGYINQHVFLNISADIRLEFLSGSGSHNVSQTLICSGNISMYAIGTHPTVIRCDETVSLRFADTGRVEIAGLVFLRCSIFADGIVVFSFSNSVVQHSRNHAVVINRAGTVTFTNSSFESNVGVTYTGGALSITNVSSIDIHNASFVKNSCWIQGGAVAIVNSTLASLSDVYFELNSANGTEQPVYGPKDSEGGAMYISLVVQVTFKDGVKMTSNKASTGGGMFLYCSQATFLGRAQFNKNRLNYNIIYGEGGGIYLSNSTITFQESTVFERNVAKEGGGICAINSTVKFHGDDAIHVFADCFSEKRGGGMYLMNSEVSFESLGASFRGNSARAGFGGAIYGFDVRVVMRCKHINFTDNRADDSGGAIHFGSDVLTSKSNQLSMIGDVLLEQNSALFYGGAIFLETTRVLLSGVIVGSCNDARYGGMLHCEGGSVDIAGESITVIANYAAGALHITQTTLVISSEKATFSSNQASRQGGGGIVAFSSRLIFTGAETYFTNNSAGSHAGGALFLSDNSRLILSSKKMTFVSNKALKGGAIFIDDTSYSQLCENKQLCFFMLNFRHQLNKQISFIQNEASSGADIYGGMLDRCKFRPNSGGRQTRRVWSFITNSTNNSTLAISSLPVRVCFCSQDSPNCDLTVNTKSVYPGGTISTSLVVVDQNNNPLPFLVVAAKLSKGSKGLLGEGESVQTLHRRCAKLTYHLISPSTRETLVLYSNQGPCRDVGISSSSIQIKVLPCPQGFELSESYKCICHKPLELFTTKCIIDTQTFLRKQNCWFNYEKNTLIAQEQCPFDFCNKNVESITIAEIDKQCAHNRTGTLCGACKGNLSLSLGSSHCQECKSPSFIWLTLLFALAGVILVAFLSIFRFTVALGTINGLIFYSNVVVINRNLLFPSGSTSNPLLVLLAWLNLDLGIETCYYDGMDMYSRTWLQFVFPLYVWSMVGVIILVSHYSTYAARVFGRNPVAALATLFLLSYTKLLRTIINVFSFISLKYPETGTTRLVWLYDGNIGYFKGKHIPLFIVALLVLLFLFLPYTIVLLFGQCLRKYSGKRGLGWARSAVFTSVLDAYHAPYKFKHRYWTGLLLLARCALFLTFSFNSLGDPTFNLLAVIITALFLVLLAAYLKVYKSRLLNFLELSFLVNMGVLSVVIHPVSLSETNKEIVNNISLAVVFLVVVGILIYHSYVQIRDTTFWRRLKERRVRQREILDITETETYPKNEPTRTVVELRNSNYLEPLLEESDNHHH